MEKSTNNLTAASIAGYCHQSALWRMVADVAKAMLATTPVRVTPDAIKIEGAHFVIDASVAEKCSPADAVWHLGAAVCHVSSARAPFGGRSQQYQANHPALQLPSLRSDHESLTPLVHKCLCANPQLRPTLEEMAEMAEKGYAKSMQRNAEEVCECKSGENPVYDDESVWPEKMI